MTMQRLSLVLVAFIAFIALEVVAIRSLPDAVVPSTARTTEASMPTTTTTITKTPTRKIINPNDSRGETPRECFDRLKCGEQGGIQGCYRCCIGCDSAIQTKCQDLCDGSAAALTGWPVEQLQAMRANHAEFVNAVHELFDAEHTAQNAHRLEYLYTIGSVETLADTRCTVTIAAGAIPNVIDPETADIYSAILQSALTDPRDPAIRRTALACLTTAWGIDSIDAMQTVTNAAINDDDQSVRDLAVKIMAKWM